MSNGLTLTEENFQQEVTNSNIPVLVDFWAAWCGPCRMVGPVVEELAQEYGGRIKVGKVDVDTQPRLAAQFGIQSIPTLLVFRDGQVVEQVIGAAAKEQLAARLDRALESAPVAAGT